MSEWKYFQPCAGINNLVSYVVYNAQGIELENLNLWHGKVEKKEESK